jgi:hypothetical protein
MGRCGRIFSAFAALAVSATVVALSPAPSRAGSTAACGAATSAAVAAAEETTTKAIYAGENSSPEVTVDAAHITGATDLVTAVADNNQAATLAAVTRIVYTPHWHIVRLRVLSSSGRVLADVGGPHVIAPVTGQLTSHGTVVGSYVMSVQDDVGYEKLVNRFTGLPIELYFDGRALLGRDFPAGEIPPKIPSNGTPMSINGTAASAVTYTVNAFPSGSLHVLLAVPKPSAALTRESCALVAIATHAQVAEMIAARFKFPAQYAQFVTTELGFGPKYIFVRSGSKQLAGTVSDGPSHIPSSGNFSYDGQAWTVFSFAPQPPARIYLLFATSAEPGSGGTGASGASGASG